MKKILLAAVVIGAMCPQAWSQSAQGYVFYAPTQYREGSFSDFTHHLGAGGRYITQKGLGLGGELNVTSLPKDNFMDHYFWMASANGYYVFKKFAKAEPFVTGGYSRDFGGTVTEHLNWGNFGGGLTYWVGKRAGIFLEFRDHLHHNSRVNLQVLTFRLGLALRSGDAR